MSKEMLLERLKLEAEVYRRIAQECAIDAEQTKQIMPGSHYLNLGKKIMCESFVNTLENIIKREEGK